MYIKCKYYGFRTQETNIDTRTKLPENITFG